MKKVLEVGKCEGGTVVRHTGIEPVTYGLRILEHYACQNSLYPFIYALYIRFSAFLQSVRKCHK